MYAAVQDGAGTAAGDVGGVGGGVLPCTPFQCEVGDPACLDRMRLSITYALDM